MCYRVRPMIVVGVDENGLGPVLGPLVGTAVAVRIERRRYDRPRLCALGERLGVKDSKQTAGFGRMAHTEGVALALLERLFGTQPADADALLGLVSLDPLSALQAPCPAGGSRAQCWSERVQLPAFGGDPVHGHRAIEGLHRRGVVPVRLRSALACAGVLNRERDEGRSRVVVNLTLFERLLLDVRQALGEELHAVCGMVSGIRHYREHLRYIAPDRVRQTRRSPERRDYRVDGVGRVRFEVDADVRHLPVGLASMLGKYLRELSVERVNRFYQTQRSSLPRASGYHDPVTRELIARSAELRRRLRVVDDCFIRRSLG